MAPKAKKACYVITSGVFNLTRWIGNTRLGKPPPLLYKPNDHLSENAWLGLQVFQTFLIFKFCSGLLFQSVFGLVNAWAVLWDEVCYRMGLDENLMS